MKPLKAIVVLTARMDAVSLVLDQPDPCWPYKNNLQVKFDTPQNQGESYVLRNFDCPVTVINERPKAENGLIRKQER